MVKISIGINIAFLLAIIFIFYSYISVMKDLQDEKGKNAYLTTALNDSNEKLKLIALDTKNYLLQRNSTNDSIIKKYENVIKQNTQDTKNTNIYENSTKKSINSNKAQNTHEKQNQSNNANTLFSNTTNTQTKALVINESKIKEDLKTCKMELNNVNKLIQTFYKNQ